MDVSIRQINADEIPCLAKIRMKFLSEISSRNFSAEFLETTIQYMQKHIQDGSFICFVAEKNQQIVSTAMICFYEYLPKINNPTGQVGYLFNVYTFSPYRGNGIGENVLRKVIAQAKSLGIKEIYLHAEIPAIPLYLRLGFEKTEQDMLLKLE